MHGAAVDAAKRDLAPTAQQSFRDPAHCTVQHNSPRFSPHRTTPVQPVHYCAAIRVDDDELRIRRRRLLRPLKGRQHSTVLRHEAVGPVAPAHDTALPVQQPPPAMHQAAIGGNTRRIPHPLVPAVTRHNQLHAPATPLRTRVLNGHHTRRTCDPMSLCAVGFCMLSTARLMRWLVGGLRLT